jgi:hypothetical protein
MNNTKDNMDNKQQLDQAVIELYLESDKFTNEIINKEGMANIDPNAIMQGFVYAKLAEFDLRLKKLERGNERAQDYLNMHTPLGG